MNKEKKRVFIRENILMVTREQFSGRMGEISEGEKEYTYCDEH